jgi:hypothetical protein
MSKAIMDGKDVTHFENRHISKTGKLVPIIWSARWDKKIKLMFCIGRDVTDKKSAEKKLIQSAVFLEAAQKKRWITSYYLHLTLIILLKTFFI